MGAGGDAGLRGKAGLGGLEALAPRRCQCVCRGSCALGPRCTLRLPPPPPPRATPTPYRPLPPRRPAIHCGAPPGCMDHCPPHVGLRVRARQSRPSAAPSPPPLPPSPHAGALRAPPADPHPAAPSPPRTGPPQLRPRSDCVRRGVTRPTGAAAGARLRPPLGAPGRSGRRARPRRTLLPGKRGRGGGGAGRGGEPSTGDAAAARAGVRTGRSALPVLPGRT